MKYILLLWGLGGPEAVGVFEREAICEGVADLQSQAIALCVPMDVDKVISDVVLYPNPEHL